VGYATPSNPIAKTPAEDTQASMSEQWKMTHGTFAVVREMCNF
jgi:hypothetical protein